MARDLKKIRGSISVEVDIDVELSEIAEQLDAEAIMAIAEYHGVDIDDHKQVVAQAITIIRAGRISDGITALERHFFPTYASRQACETAYETAMALKRKGASS